MGGGESDYSVCPRPLLQLLQFLQFFQFMSDRLRQFTLEGRDVELDNNCISKTLTDDGDIKSLKYI